MHLLPHTYMVYVDTYICIYHTHKYWVPGTGHRSTSRRNRGADSIRATVVIFNSVIPDTFGHEIHGLRPESTCLVGQCKARSSNHSSIGVVYTSSYTRNHLVGENRRAASPHHTALSIYFHVHVLIHCRSCYRIFYCLPRYNVV